MSTPEPMTADINITIAANGGETLSLQQRYLGLAPFVLFELNEQTLQFDVEAGGGIPDLKALKQLIGYMAEALGCNDEDADVTPEAQYAGSRGQLADRLLLLADELITRTVHSEYDETRSALVLAAQDIRRAVQGGQS